MQLDIDPLLKDNHVTKGRKDLRFGTCVRCRYGIFIIEELVRVGVDVLHRYCVKE